MPQPRAVRCTNCGTKWTPAERALGAAGSSPAAAVCPVCRMAMPAGDVTLKRPMTAGDLAAQIGALITSARASNLDSAVIVQILRDELEFAAEMGQAGRHFCVQLIDLGPKEGDILQRPVRDRRALLQTRSTN